MNLNSRFRPKADLALLRQLNDQTWQAKSNEMTARVHAEVCSVLTDHIESLYPASDMVILARYDCARTISAASLRVRMPGSDRWSESASIPLARSVTVATSYQFLYCGGPRYSTEPGHGLTAATIDEIKAGRNSLFKSWDSYLAHHAAEERRRVPESIEPAIFELVSAYLQYRDQCRQIIAWPKEYHDKCGFYPTWGEIAEHFSITGALLESL